MNVIITIMIRFFLSRKALVNRDSYCELLTFFFLNVSCGSHRPSAISFGPWTLLLWCWICMCAAKGTPTFSSWSKPPSPLPFPLNYSHPSSEAFGCRDAGSGHFPFGWLMVLLVPSLSLVILTAARPVNECCACGVSETGPNAKQHLYTQ